MSLSNTKLFQTLQNFDAYEMNRLEKFIQSPYHNKSERIIALFIAIKEPILNSNSETIEKELLWTQIYPDEEYQDQKLRLVQSDLLKLIIEFIGYEEYKANQLQKGNNELRGISHKNLDALYGASTRNIENSIKKDKKQDGNHYLERYKMETELFHLTSEFEKKTQAKKVVLNYLEINKNLDFYYLIEKLKWYNNYLSWTRMKTHFQDIQYIDVILKIVESLGSELPIALQIYYKIYLTQSNAEDSKSFYELKNLIYKNSKLFHKKEAKELYEALINFSVRQVNKGNSEYYEEVLQIYMSGIDNKILLDSNNYLTPTSFRNICALGLRLKKYSWTLDFINNNILLLDSKYRDNAYKFNLARVYFYKEEYDKVIETIREVEFNDALYTNVSKTLLLISYYELEDDDTLFYFADSFNIYLKRNKNLSDRIRKEYLNLVKFAKKLTKARFKPSILIKLKQEILDTDVLASRQWFLDKLKDVKIPDEA